MQTELFAQICLLEDLGSLRLKLFFSKFSLYNIKHNSSEKDVFSLGTWNLHLMLQKHTKILNKEMCVILSLQ